MRFMTRPPESNRVSLAASDWVRLGIFLLVQTIATVGIGIDMRERLRVVETRLEDRDKVLDEMRAELRLVQRDRDGHARP